MLLQVLCPIGYESTYNRFRNPTSCIPARGRKLNVKVNLDVWSGYPNLGLLYHCDTMPMMPLLDWNFTI